MTKDERRVTDTDPLSEIELAAAGEIRARVLEFFEGADPNINDGTSQKVGPYTVSIRQRTVELGDIITTFHASSNGLSLANREIYKTGSGLTLTDAVTLHGAVDNDQVNVSANKALGKDSVLISVSNPHLVLPGRPHSIRFRALDAGYKAKVSKAFGIKL